MDYHFEDFTETNYRRLLNIAKANNHFIDYQRVKEEKSGIVWRHDIDFSVHRARTLAQIEYEEGVSSTWFVYLHCSFYNVLEKEVTEQIKAINRLGGGIGLHFEPAYYSIEFSETDMLNDYIAREKKLLEDFLEAPVTAMSFHNPDVGGMWHTLETESFSGLFNVYCPYMRRYYQYCSDSNGYWRFQRLEDVLLQCKDKRLQVLTHPVWWQESVMPPRKRVERSAFGRARRIMREYDDLLAACNRENVDE